MTIQPGDLPSFDAEAAPNPHFDDYALAQKVIWPLISRYAGVGDWATDTSLTDTMERKIRGEFKHGGTHVDLVLSARNCLQRDVDEDPIEGLPHTGFGEFIVERLIEGDGLRDEILDDAEPHADGDITSENRADVIVKETVEYTFSAVGIFGVAYDRKIEDVDGDVLWCESVSGDESDGGPSEEPNEAEFTLGDHFSPEDIIFGRIPTIKLYQADMAQLESGLYVARANRSLWAAFSDIRSNPLT